MSLWCALIKEDKVMFAILIFAIASVIGSSHVRSITWCSIIIEIQLETNDIFSENCGAFSASSPHWKQFI